MQRSAYTGAVRMAVALGLLAAISYGSADFLGGLATKRNPAIRAALFSQALGFAVYLVALPLLPEGRLTGEAWLWGGLAGLTGGVGLAFLYRGLAHGRMSVVAPITAVIAAVLPVAFGLFTGERPSTLQLAGIGLAIPAIALVSSAPHASGRVTPAGTTVRSRAAAADGGRPRLGCVGARCGPDAQQPTWRGRRCRSCWGDRPTSRIRSSPSSPTPSLASTCPTVDARRKFESCRCSRR